MVLGEAPNPGASAAVTDAAIVLSSAIPSITTTEAPLPLSVVLSPEEALRRERRLALRHLRPLGMGANNIDLSLDLSVLDEHNRQGMAYEEDCFSRVIETLGENELAYGPHLLTLVFASADYDFAMGKRHIAVPDAMVVEQTTTGILDSGIPVEIPAVKIRRLIEFRQGVLEIERKTRGFSNLLKGIRANPEEAAELFNRVLKGRGGRMNPVILLAPENRQIEVHYYSPKNWSEDAHHWMRKSVERYRFGKIDFVTVPRRQSETVPQSSPAA
jgi:hypothetical protein